MPNHVINEVVFSGIDAAAQDRIAAVALNEEGVIDFEVLVPSPINIWRYSVGSIHEKTFPDTHLAWARKNWGTKWNAYGQPSFQFVDGTLTMRFQTAWRPPYGWLVALFNTIELPFTHNWLSEDCERGVTGIWDSSQAGNLFAELWKELPATDEMQKHLHLLLYGCEAFEDEDEDEAVAE